MDLDQLRASILDALGIHLSEHPHDELTDSHEDVLITAGPEHLTALTNWLDRTDTGRHIFLDFFETKGPDGPAGDPAGTGDLDGSAGAAPST